MSEKNSVTLSQKIKDWLEKQGYSLEMRVAKAFRENGFSVSQFERYIDQESESVRQTDVVASLSRNIGNSLFTTRLFIECKYAQRPWIILVTPEKFERFAFFSRILQGKHPSDWKNFPTLQGRLVSRILSLLDNLQGLETFAIDRVGYTVLDTFIGKAEQERESIQEKKKQDKSKESAFEATVQVSKSVEAHDVKNEEVFKNTFHSFENSLNTERGSFASSLSLDLSIAFPVIVIQGRLFNGYLGDDNEIHVSEVDDGVVFVPYRQKEIRTNIQVPLSPVRVATEHNLNNFIMNMHGALISLLEQDDAIQDLIDYEQSRITMPSSDTDF